MIIDIKTDQDEEGDDAMIKMVKMKMRLNKKEEEKMNKALTESVNIFKKKNMSFLFFSFILTNVL